MASHPMKSIPRISWHQMVDEDGNPRREGATLFGDALKVTGFAIIQDAPFRSDLLDRNYELMKAVFELGVNRLTQKYTYPDIGHQRGYMPTKTEFGIRCGGDPDDKEVIAFGSYHNVDIPDVPAYRLAAEEYYRACQDVGYTLMHVLSLYLDPEGKERDYLLGLFRDEQGNPTDDSHMRHIRYPGNAKRMACEHTDSNMLTLLPAATRSGLEVQNNRGEWIGANTAKGDLVINAGDMLNFVSGGKISSTLHRVENKNPDPDAFRHSMPFFFHPDHTKELRILEACQNEPVERRMFPYQQILGYHLLYELLSTYKMIPEEIGVEEWVTSMEKMKHEGFALN